MPNNAYERSVRRERELVNEYRKLGWDACRSAGSHSPWDVWAFDPVNKRVLLIQVKTKKGGRAVRLADMKLYLNVTVVTETHHYE